MRIYLVQHAIAVPKDENTPDPGLSEKGRQDLNRIGEVARGYGVFVRRMRHSPLQRATETAILFSEWLQPPEGIRAESGLLPKDPVSGWVDAIQDHDMIIGHLPFLSRLLSRFLTGKEDTDLFRFQNAGIVCLEKQEAADWQISWTLMPQIG